MPATPQASKAQRQPSAGLSATKPPKPPTMTPQ